MKSRKFLRVHLDDPNRLDKPREFRFCAQGNWGVQSRSRAGASTQERTDLPVGQITSPSHYFPLGRGRIAQNTAPGGKGPCLTDAARFALSRRRVRVVGRYAMIRTCSINVRGFLCGGGVIKTSLARDLSPVATGYNAPPLAPHCQAGSSRPAATSACRGVPIQRGTAQCMHGLVLARSRNLHGLAAAETRSSPIRRSQRSRLHGKSEAGKSAA
jgi:hypothetical protein